MKWEDNVGTFINDIETSTGKRIYWGDWRKCSSSLVFDEGWKVPETTWHFIWIAPFNKGNQKVIVLGVYWDEVYQMQKTFSWNTSWVIHQPIRKVLPVKLQYSRRKLIRYSGNSRENLKLFFSPSRENNTSVTEVFLDCFSENSSLFFYEDSIECC